MRFNRCFILAAIISVTPSAIADEFRSKINDGYDLYKSGEYDKAAEQFKEAGILKPDHALPSYDKGAALYKSNDFEGAAGEFESSVARNDSKLKSDALFNAGNAYFKAQKYDQAVKSYVDALKSNSKDKDYKHNLELALREMQRQQQQQKQNQNKDDKQKQDQKQNQDQKKQDQLKKDEQKLDQQKSDQQQQQDQAQKDKQDMKKDQQKGTPDQEQMNREKAEELLARFADDEKDIQKRLKQMNVRGRSVNDW